MLALAVLLQAATAQAPLIVQRDRLLETYWAVNGPAMSRCETSALKVRFAAAKAEFDQVTKAYYVRASKDGTWQPPPVFSPSFYSCDQAEPRIAALEVATASFNSALARP